MTESSEPTSSSDTSMSNPTRPDTSDRRTTGQKWRRRIIVALTTILICFVVVRALIPLLLPTVLTQVAARYDLDARYDKLDFNLLGGDVGIWNLRLLPRSGGEPVLSIGYCRGAVSTLGLLKGRLDVERAEAEDTTLVVERFPDGSLPLVDRFFSTSDKPRSLPGDQPREIPLEPPLSIDTLRLQRAEARFVDRMVDPTTDVRFFLDVILMNIGKPDVPTVFSAQLHSPQVLGALYVEGQATSRDKLVNADLDLRMLGLNLQPLQTYLAAFGVTPSSKDISATARGKLRMTPAGNPATRPADAPVTSVTVQLQLKDILLTADSRQAASVQTVSVDIPFAAPGHIHVHDILVDDVRGYAMRDPQGRPTFAGIALGAEPTTIEQRVQPSVATTAYTEKTSDPSHTSGLPVIELDSLVIRNVEFQFTDFAIPEPQNIYFDVDQIRLTDISTDPAKSDQVSRFEFVASASGLAESVRLNGDIRAAPSTKTLDLNAHLSGITGAVLDPYLRPLGITRVLDHADLTATMTFEVDPFSQPMIQTAFRLKDLRLTDKAHEWFVFDQVDASNIRIARDGSELVLGNIDIRGPTMSLTRSSDGSITAFGFRFDPSQIQPANHNPTTLAPSATASSSTQTPFRLPSVRIEQLTWGNVSLSVQDATVKPAVSYKLMDVNARIDRLTLDPSARTSEPGSITVSLQSPGNLDHLAINGTVTPTGQSLAFDLSGSSDGITLAGLRPLLNTLGFDPVLQQGTFQFQAKGDIRHVDQGIQANLSLTNLSLTDASGDQVRLKGLELNQALFHGQTVSVQGLVIDRPSVQIQRDEQGNLIIGGMKRITPADAPPPPPADPMAPPFPSELNLDLPVILRLQNLKLDSAELTFVDRLVRPAITLKPRLSLSLQNATVGTDSEPAGFDLDLDLPGVIEKMNARGTLRAAPDHQTLQVRVQGQGIGGELLTPYLPTGTRLNGDRNTFGASLGIEIQKHPQGGSRLDLTAKDIVIRSDADDSPAFSLNQARLRVNRIDLPGKVVDVEQISTQGLNVRVEKTDQGWVLPFVLLGQDPSPGMVITKPASSIQPPSGQSLDVDQLIQAAKQTAPLVSVKKLDIGADELSLQTPGMVYPLSIRQLSVSGQDIRLLGDKPEQQPPFTIHLQTRAENLVDSVVVRARLQPFSAEPQASIRVDIDGIRGNQITGLLPSLANTIDGSGLTNGRFTCQIDTQLMFSRRGWFGIDPTRDIGARSLQVRDTYLTEADQPNPLLGVEQINVEQLRISQNPTQLTIKTVDIVRPSAHLWRDQAGIHLAGMIYRLPTGAQPENQPQPIPAGAEKTPPSAPQATAEVVQAVDQSFSDLTIQTLTVSGCDFLIEDRVGTPLTRLPFTNLDLEVKGLTTRAFRQDLPIRFSVFAESGKVPFFNPDGSETTPRELFAQFMASGLLQVYPQPKGWLKTSLSGWDLRSVRGIAQQIGIEIGQGTLDFAADVRMDGSDTFEARLFPTLNSIRIKDSPDGKLARLFQLSAAPAPLDVLIVTAEDADGALSLPTKVVYKTGQLDVGTIIRSAAGSVGAQLLKAFAAVPTKALSLVGIDLNTEKDLSPVVIEFEPGESTLTPDQILQIDTIIDRLRKDPTLQIALEHRLGSSDYDLVNQRANPDPADAAALATRLRKQKHDLQKQLVELSTQFRLAMSGRDPDWATQLQGQLQSVSEKLSQTEDALDHAFELIRPGADRDSERRTKSAALELARWRLSTIRQPILDSGVKQIQDRVSGPQPTASVDPDSSQGRVVIRFGRRAKQ